VGTITTDTRAAASDFYALIDWGDGTTETLGLISGSGGSLAILGSHTYEFVGSYTMALTVNIPDQPDSQIVVFGTATVT
jgi:hypothetical protein